ncbi:cationic amino acid transporter 2 [Elysia marginata]|uniref:Cationic amino acid transporter 2 n=1 Tax=Elysia marginata TaxID=1093978 RepID=A0AAV4J6U6_9GAST|nr:cationic amino acid transporter 2 [Elysia marginata]
MYALEPWRRKLRKPTIPPWLPGEVNTFMKLRRRLSVTKRKHRDDEQTEEPIGLLIAGVKESARFNNFFTCVNLLVVLYVTICGLFKLNTHNWSLSQEEVPEGYGQGGFMPYGFSGMMAGAATCFYAFIGFDCVATTGEETKNPQKTTPIAIVVSLFVICLAYCGEGDDDDIYDDDDEYDDNYDDDDDDDDDDDCDDISKHDDARCDNNDDNGSGGGGGDPEDSRNSDNHDNKMKILLT